MSEYRILLADDHSIVRKGLRTILEEDGSLEVVAEASNGREAVDLCQSLEPHIAVMDVSMPQLNGLEAAAQVKDGLGKRGMGCVAVRLPKRGFAHAAKQDAAERVAQ